MISGQQPVTVGVGNRLILRRRCLGLHRPLFAHRLGFFATLYFYRRRLVTRKRVYVSVTILHSASQDDMWCS